MDSVFQKRIEATELDLGAALSEVAGFRPAKFTGFDDLTRAIGAVAGTRLGFGEELPFELAYSDAEEMSVDLVRSSNLEQNVNFCLKLSPFVVPGMLSISRPVFYTWLELAMGGSRNGDTVYPERAPTRLEYEIGRAFCRRVCDAIFQAFRGVVAITSAHIVPDDRGEGLGRWIRRGQQVCMFYEAKIGSVAGEVALVVPLAMLMPLRGAEITEKKAEAEAGPRVDAVWDAKLRNTVDGTPLDLHAVLGRRQMTLGDAADLKVGQVLRLDRPTGDPIVVEADGLPVFCGMLGFNKGRYMLKFERMLDARAGDFDELSG